MDQDPSTQKSMQPPSLVPAQSNITTGTNGTHAAPPKFSLSLSKPKPAQNAHSNNSATTTTTSTASLALKRAHALTLGEENDTAQHLTAQGPVSTLQIQHFGADTAAEEERKKRRREEEGRVIQSLPNKDWREESRRKRQKSGLPGQGGGEGAGKNGGGAAAQGMFAAPVAYGLTVMERLRSNSPQADETSALPPTNNTPSTAPEEPTTDSLALSALLSGNPSTSTSTTILPAAPPTEDSAFRASFASAPRVATLDEYTATPVEGYGAAILRGYLRPGETLEGRAPPTTDAAKRIKGSKDGKGAAAGGGANGAPVRRPGLLGLGAKEGPGGSEGVELGVWNRRGGGGGGRGGRREEVVYNPVAMRNRKTGEVVSEEELKRRVEVSRTLVIGEVSDIAPERKRIAYSGAGAEREVDEERRRERRGGRRDGNDDVEKDDEGHDSRHRHRRRDGESDRGRDKDTRRDRASGRDGDGGRTRDRDMDSGRNKETATDGRRDRDAHRRRHADMNRTDRSTRPEDEDEDDDRRIKGAKERERERERESGRRYASSTHRDRDRDRDRERARTTAAR